MWQNLTPIQSITRKKNIQAIESFTEENEEYKSICIIL